MTDVSKRTTVMAREGERATHLFELVFGLIRLDGHALYSIRESTGGWQIKVIRHGLSY